MQIHISDHRARNARVTLVSRKRAPRTCTADSQGRPVTSARLVKGSLKTDRACAQMPSDDLAKALIAGNPELDIELFGKQVRETNRIYLTEDSRPAQAIAHREEVFGADGHLKDARERRSLEGNINTAVALKWGRLIPKKKAAGMMVFTGSYQVTHGDGLTYDFLYGMAKELQEKEALMMLGAGEKGTDPLVFRRNGTPYRAFLEGRIQGDEYLLVVHLTNLELKSVA